MARVCDISECGRPHYGRGYCSMHWKRWNKYGDPLKTKLNKAHNGFCKIEDCGGDYYALGWCRKHHRRWQVHGSPRALLVKRVDDRPSVCVVKNCEIEHYAQDLCRIHYNVIVRHGLTASKYEDLIEAQGFRCDICKLEFKSTPNVDHDHKCCPGWKSCGECVRGLLCKLCNAALGAFQDDLTTLKEAIKYIEKHMSSIKP